MEHELISNKSVAIIGAGPAGCICAKILLDNGIVPTVFEKNKPLLTILPTGGGRCNLSYEEYDFKELAKNYPRGEKFLYSVFSKFSIADTLDFFNSIGVETYTQVDSRIFPKSNSSREVRDKLLASISKSEIVNENVIKISKLESGYKITTNKAQYAFDYIVISIGGHGNFKLLEDFGLKIIPPTQSLVGLITKEDFKPIAGVSIQNVQYDKICADILFTHRGISGPLIYKISSIKAKKEFPYKLTLKLIPEINLQEELDKNPHKSIKNLLGQWVPKSFANYILSDLNINSEKPCHKIDGKTRDMIYSKLINFEINTTGKVPDGEVVTSGGIDLNQINPKTMEVKTLPKVFACGEVLDIDGFCGGFNLQNCWSTGMICAYSILQM